MLLYGGNQIKVCWAKMKFTSVLCFENREGAGLGSKRDVKMGTFGDGVKGGFWNSSLSDLMRNSMCIDGFLLR